MEIDSILDRLDDFIDVKSPKLARVLCSTWKDQQSAITYHELRDAILDGHLNMDYLSQWQQDYSQFVAEHYAPMVQSAVEEAAKGLLGEYGGSLVDPQFGLMDDYIRENGAKFISEISAKQFSAINTLVRQATMTSTMTVDQLARAIRPCIGLTERQTAAANNLYRKLREDGMSHKQALKREISYASKQQRYRAATIAQTEMARAYNSGCDAVVKQNVEAGYVGEDSTRTWFTAKDERVCPTCGAMHGETVALDAPFSNGSMTPPGHPCCRCTIKYNLTAPRRSKKAV
jgi:SPP1 gp7 family putative phage head morphogenesis protein